MQQELEELRDAAQDVGGLVEIPEGNEDESLTLGGEASESTRELRKVRLHNHPIVRGTCTRVGEVLLAMYSP
jgi:hypothetical protein